MGSEERVRGALRDLIEGRTDIDSVVELIRSGGYDDLVFAKLDTDRESRMGCPEVIYCEGKTLEQIRSIAQEMLRRGSGLLATRATDEVYGAIKGLCKDAEYNSLARTVVVKRNVSGTTKTYIAVVTAGTSDLPVAEEAVETARFLGNRVELISDVGVAGIHRLLDNIGLIRGARVVVVVAGMEGALASVVGGLIDKPVIAVPTSVGYGANFGGLSALLSMLNSCANGVCVVNIDNGFGAGYVASAINKL